MRLNSDQIEEVIKKPIISIVATLRKDGSAHMTPVWHILYEDFVYIVIEDSSVKSKNLKNDDRISLCIATETKPQKWVQINGKAQLTKNNIYFILVKPQLAENIGFVARGLKNFNIKNLRIVKNFLNIFIIYLQKKIQV